MKKSLYILCLGLLALTACDKAPKLDVEGAISDAAGKILYFERFGLDSVQTLDSVTLDGKGSYHFKTRLPAYPEFYRLRIENRFIHLAADSSVHIKLNADGRNFGNHYQITGSTVCERIQELSLLQGTTLISVDSLSSLYKAGGISSAQYQERMLEIFDKHRIKAKGIILKNPRSPAAYFALLQRIHNFLIFDPYDAQDNKCYAAVATSWDTFYPNSLRSKNLKMLTLQGMKEIRQNRNNQKVEYIDQAKTSMFEIKLPDIYGKTIPLSSLQGKVVLLDFTAYKGEFSPSRNLDFRKLYQTYAPRGFEIYQVSLDVNEQFWKTAAVNLPWTCVNDKNSIESEYLRTFNVQAIPTYFLIDRNGNIVLRDSQVKNLNQAVEKLL